MKYYLKKWGSWVKNNEYHYPILSPVYKKSIIINNSNEQLERILDPWFNGGKDIIVTVDGMAINEQDYQNIQHLNDIIKDNGEIGEFELCNLKIKINSLESFEQELVKI